MLIACCWVPHAALFAEGRFGKWADGHERKRKEVCRNKRRGEEEIREKLELYKAAMNGDWEMAMHKLPMTTRINKRGETALHIATAANHTHFVQKLVEMIARNNKEHLAIKTVRPSPVTSITPTAIAPQAPALGEVIGAAATAFSIQEDPSISRTQAAVAVNLTRRAEDRIQAAVAAPQPQEPAPQPVEQRNTTPAAIAPQAVVAAPTAGQIVEDPTIGRTQAAAALAFATANAIAAQQENAQVTTVVTILAPAAAPQPVDTASQSVEQGNTAFCYAAISGNVKIAKIMKDERNDLPRIRGGQNYLPIYLAALAGHAKMVHELYKDYHSNNEVTDDDRISLLIALVESDIYDVALKMIQDRPKLATMKDKDGKRSALHAFAEKPCIPSIQTSTGIWSYCINFLSNKEKRRQGLELVKKLWEKVILDDEDKVSQFMIVPSGRLIFIAAENGNVEFLTILIRKYPHLVFKVDDNQYTIFHKAILNRHEKIFMLIFELSMLKNLINIYEDKDGNNMLHLAGKMPKEESRVNVVPGAALQLQRELQWFEVVKKVVRPGQIAAKNVDGKTPRDVFMKEHKELREAAEKWMINTANSCMLVATLIATVVFAAAFTVPGGNGQDTGIPIFVRDTLFKIFAVADGVSLAFSTSSILSFLSILTSRFSMDDFLKSLPNKLILGLLFLFIAIITMMGAFVLAFFLIFKHRNIGFAISIAAVASLPILLFIWQLYLLIEMVRSTYLSFLLCCNKKSLFPSKSKFQRLKKLCCCFN